MPIQTKRGVAKSSIPYLNEALTGKSCYDLMEQHLQAPFPEEYAKPDKAPSYAKTEYTNCRLYISHEIVEDSIAEKDREEYLRFRKYIREIFFFRAKSLICRSSDQSLRQKLLAYPSMSASDKRLMIGLEQWSFLGNPIHQYNFDCSEQISMAPFGKEFVIRCLKEYLGLMDGSISHKIEYDGNVRGVGNSSNRPDLYMKYEGLLLFVGELKRKTQSAKKLNAMQSEAGKQIEKTFNGKWIQGLPPDAIIIQCTVVGSIMRIGPVSVKLGKLDFTQYVEFDVADLKQEGRFAHAMLCCALEMNSSIQKITKMQRKLPAQNASNL